MTSAADASAMRREAVGVGDVEVAGLHTGLVDQAGDAVGGFAFGPVDHSDGGRDASSGLDPSAVIWSTLVAARTLAKVTV